jgi:hypothetical protein
MMAPLICWSFSNSMFRYLLVDHAVPGAGCWCESAASAHPARNPAAHACRGRVPSWDQMKPRTVYEKAVQDFTETAQQLARLNQHFRQASFSEFEMLMGLDDEVLKRYGLPKPTVKRALIKAYETVVLDQQR